jgi:chromosome segregation ATPase
MPHLVCTTAYNRESTMAQTPPAQERRISWKNLSFLLFSGISFTVLGALFLPSGLDFLKGSIGRNSTFEQRVEMLKEEAKYQKEFRAIQQEIVLLNQQLALAERHRDAFKGEVGNVQQKLLEFKGQHDQTNYQLSLTAQCIADITDAAESLDQLYQNGLQGNWGRVGGNVFVARDTLERFVVSWQQGHCSKAQQLAAELEAQGQLQTAR